MAQRPSEYGNIEIIWWWITVQKEIQISWKRSTYRLKFEHGKLSKCLRKFDTTVPYVAKVKSVKNTGVSQPRWAIKLHHIRRKCKNGNAGFFFTNGLPAMKNPDTLEYFSRNVLAETTEVSDMARNMKMELLTFSLILYQSKNCGHRIHILFMMYDVYWYCQIISAGRSRSTAENHWPWTSNW
jgi:hypothetical protein